MTPVIVALYLIELSGFRRTIVRPTPGATGRKG